MLFKRIYAVVGTVYYKGKQSNHRHFSRVEGKQTGHCVFSGSSHWSSGTRRERHPQPCWHTQMGTCPGELQLEVPVPQLKRILTGITALIAVGSTALPVFLQKGTPPG